MMESAKSTPPLVQDAMLKSTQPPSWQSRLQALAKSRLVATVLVSAGLNFGLTGFSTWQVWQTSQSLQNTVRKSIELQTLSGEVTYYDELLTMSAFMAASTGNPTWKSRYDENLPKLLKVVDTLLASVPKSVQAAPEQTDAAVKVLEVLETKAFELIGKGQSAEAFKILTSDEYSKQKKLYSQGTEETLKNVKQFVENQLITQRSAVNNSISLAGLSLLLLLLTSYLVLLAVQGYIRDQRQAQAELSDSQVNLLQLNEQLGEEVTQRTAQQKKIVEESNVLQADIAHILDVVCAIEEGDLDIEAEVNERATGLIADTLNRLIESLTRIVNIVNSNALQVTNSAFNLEEMAVETVSQAQRQTVSVEEVQQLIEQVNVLTLNSRQQATQTSEELELAKTAISEGQEEMVAMVDGIVTLQQGTEQIIKRTQSLNEFVELATQFSKDQKRVAALTKVLAFNASLLSSRAMNEQDPAQFTTIAREFETIATQVNSLAGETNLSLGLLQQRTTQIQTVTSGLNQDVLEIGQLVRKFTGEVDRSKKAFNNIQTVTERVAVMGEQVTISSWEISQAVESTLLAMQSIASIAQNTEGKATLTRQQVADMRLLASSLLQVMEFFRMGNSTPTLLEPNVLASQEISLQQAAALN